MSHKIKRQSFFLLLSFRNKAYRLNAHLLDITNALINIMYVTSWDKISRMSKFFHIELDIPDFRPYPVLQTGGN